MTERKRRGGLATSAERYRILRGISWATGDTDEKGRPTWENVEAGEVRADLPVHGIEEWIRIGAIEPVTKDTPEKEG